MLGERGRTKRSAAAHGAVDRPSFLTFILHRHLDAGANRRPIGFDSYEVETDPIVAIARVLEQPERVTVARHGSANFGQQIFIAVIVDIGEGHTMAFMQFTGTRRGRNVGKEFALFVVEQYVRKQGSVARTARTQI